MRTDEDKMMPPVKGWQYGWWEADPTLEASRQVSKPCSEVLVELHGAAKEEQPECAGIYKPLKGRHNRGRWVGSFLLIDIKMNWHNYKKRNSCRFRFICTVEPPTSPQLLSFIPICLNQYKYRSGIEFFEEGAHH